MSNYNRYSPANVQPFEFADSQQKADVLQEAVEQRLGEAENGQHFSAIHVNRAFTDNPVFVRMNSLFGSTANADQQYIASQYAAAFPENPYLSIDLPAHGASDKLTKEQRKAITKTDGSLETAADAQIEAAQNLVPNLKDVVLTGEAMGGLFAVEFAARAAAKGIRVRHLFGFGVLGMENRKPLVIAGSYLFNAQKSRVQRHREANEAGEQKLEDAYSKVFIPEIEEYGPTKTATQVGHAGLMARERTVARLMLKKSPLTRDVGVRALGAALKTQPSMKTNFVFAGNDVIGRLTPQVEESLRNLNKSTGARIDVNVWPDDNQDIGLARHQPRLIKYIQDNIAK